MPRPSGWARVAGRGVAIYNRPSISARQLGLYRADTVVNIYERQFGEGENWHNPLWFLTGDGWVCSSYIQPVRNDLNKPVLNVPAGGFLAEATVPFTEAWRTEDGDTRVAYRFYYSTTYWVDRVVTDEKNNVWYRIPDNRYPVFYFVLAKHLRRIPDAELLPLSPAVRDKHIEVDLAQQRLTAYENGQSVFTARFSSGRAGWETPTGTFRVERKRPSRHMAAGDLAAGDGFDLPGVPWASFFSWTGSGFHGTYRHDDFGRPPSRGCVSLTPADAKRIFRWTLPLMPRGKDFMQDKNGTEVSVF